MLNTRNYITLDGVDLRTFGLYISGQGAFNSPARAINMLEIPGRDGALIGKATRLTNGTLTYPAFICRDFQTNAEKLRAFLLSHVGYMRLVDTYNPSEFRMVAFRGPLTISANRHNSAGQFDLTFECMPQRWLLSGETTKEFTSSGHIYNPTRFIARPLIRAYVSGTRCEFSVYPGDGEDYIEISIRDPDYSYVDIDCALREAYYGTPAASQNARVSVSDYDFPYFLGADVNSGNNSIRGLYNITKLVVTPRWWTV